MKKILVFMAVLIVVIACGLMITYGPLHAQGGAADGDIIDKLDAISKSQGDLMAAINSIKEELQIIKIRVTQSQ